MAQPTGLPSIFLLLVRDRVMLYMPEEEATRLFYPYCDVCADVMILVHGNWKGNFRHSKIAIFLKLCKTVGDLHRSIGKYFVFVPFGSLG